MPAILVAVTDSIVSVIVGSLFATAVIGIMLSTVDSFLATNVFVAVYDILPSTKQKIDNEKATSLEKLTMEESESLKVIKTAKTLALYTMLGGIGLYIVGAVLIDNPFSLLFFGFSIPLALAPTSIAAAILPQALRNAIGEWVTLSVIVGVAASATIFVESLSSPDLAYLPPLYAVSGSTATLIVGWVIATTYKAIRSGKP